MGLLDIPGISRRQADARFLQRIDPVALWAASHRGIGSRFPVMASPPTVTFGGNTSSVNGGNVNGATTYTVQDARLQSLGSVFLDGTSGGARPNRRPQHITTGLGAKSGGSAPIRVRFMSDAPAIDFCFLDALFSQFNLIVDGEIVARSNVTTFTNSGNYRYIKVDFGANATTYSKAKTSITPAAGGSGYVVGDLITLNGGTGSAAGTGCVLKVTSVLAGAVLTVDVETAGAYTTLPTGTFAQASTTGIGTGFTCSANFFHPDYSTRKMRRYELIYSDPATFIGLSVTSSDTVLPYKANPRTPKLCVIGDSIQAGTYLAYGGSHIGAGLAQRLGLWDNVVISAQGGTGWNTDNGNSLRWSSATRLQDFIGVDADIYLFIGSQNDTAGAPLQAAVTAALNTLRAAMPDAYIVGIGNVVGGSTTIAASIAAGFAGASDQSRLAFLNNQSPVQWLPSGTAWTVTSDANHLSQPGQDRWEYIASEQVLQALQTLVSA